MSGKEYNVGKPDKFQILREYMIGSQLGPHRIRDRRVLAAMRRVPRHEFVLPGYRHLAYDDRSLPIGYDQYLPEPSITAVMAQALRLRGHERVLEVGTGSGYQTAILSTLAQEVYSLERHPILAKQAAKRLGHLGYAQVEVHIGDGSQGLPDMAPYEAILVTAAAPALPRPLCAQLHPEGGRMVIAIGADEQQSLLLVIRQGDRFRLKTVQENICLMPLIGRHGFIDVDDSLANV